MGIGDHAWGSGEEEVGEEEIGSRRGAVGRRGLSMINVLIISFHRKYTYYFSPTS